MAAALDLWNTPRMEASRGRDETFEVSSSPTTAAGEPPFEGGNVCRVAALSMMLGGDQTAVSQLRTPLSALGFDDRLSSGESAWFDIDPLGSFGDLRPRDGGEEGAHRSRVAIWQLLNETGDASAAVAFLVAVLGSSLERESAAAAAALWRQLSGLYARRPWSEAIWRDDMQGPEWPPRWARFPWSLPGEVGFDATTEAEPVEWNPGQWSDIYQTAMSWLSNRYEDISVIALLVRARLSQALRSRDRITRSLAMAAFAPSGPGNGDVPPAGEDLSTSPGALAVSTMIHGTWGWKGDWWRPSGTFHKFIRDNYRPNLYSRGARFSWSGAYRRADRDQAAQDFAEWSHEVAPNGLQTVFAHSYGGDVAARAALQGTRPTELVLLSSPVNRHVERAAELNLRVLDIRLAFDPVLALARTRQRLRQRPNVSFVLLKRWRLDHGASHQALVWRAEDVARRGAL
jgi:hypothetical protein